ncbi:hypothetical protein [Paracoccus sp. PAR01]|uniref:hypothetical protein n=1 Tax=Paracoccus sp. PAR01 TaxID=2769282 RepID=UPI00177D826A|nr:hypothetical protein [Paracoccus sp. PAR01]MBD9528672.1 hypothetical protein [Paracoccus sp. PAR01]
MAVVLSFTLAGFLNVWGEKGNGSGRLTCCLSLTESRTIGPLPAQNGLSSGLSIDEEVDTKQFNLTLQEGYRFYESDNIMLDALAGARYWPISNCLTVSALGQSRRFKENFSWLNPLAGARIFATAKEAWCVQAKRILAV